MNAAQQYAVTSNPFGARGKYYGAAGHRGADFRADAGDIIYSPVSGTVVAVGKTKALGTYVVVEVAPGWFFGWAHVINPPPVGLTVKVDDAIANVAGEGDEPGSSWSGPHIHTSYSTNRLGIISGAVADPVPFIRIQIATTLNLKEDEMQLMLKREKRHETWLLTPGRAFSTRDSGQEDRAKEAGVPKRPDPVSDPEFISYLEVFGLEEYVTDLDIFTSKRTPQGTAVLASWAKAGKAPTLTAAQLATIGEGIKVPTAAAIAAAVKFPTVKQIAEEVIKHQKLPGN